MTSWVVWLGVVVASSALYQVAMKLVSVKLPLSVYFVVCGAFLMTFGVIQYAMNPEKITLNSQSIWPLLLVGLVGLGTVGIDMGYFNMYKFGAPLAVSRALATILFTLVTMVLGILMFHEHLSIRQVVGIFVSVAGVVLITYKAP